MAGYRTNGLTGANMTKALGKMVGLLLSLYVFDEVIDAIIPSIVQCPATHPTALANSTISLTQCSNGTAIVDTGTFGVFFDTAITFIGNLFPVVGILGAFEIIYSALKQARLV